MARLGLRRRQAVMQEVETCVNRSAGQPELARQMLEGAVRTRFAGSIWAALLPILMQFAMKALQDWLDGKLNTPQARLFGIWDDEDSQDLDADDVAVVSESGALPAASTGHSTDDDTVELS